MTMPVSPISTMAASGLSEKQLHLDKNQRFVVRPPDKFYKYSVYEDLALGEDRFKEILGSIKQKPPEMKHRKTKSLIKNIIGLGVLALGGFFVFKNFGAIKGKIVNIAKAIKNFFIVR